MKRINLLLLSIPFIMLGAIFTQGDKILNKIAGGAVAHADAPVDPNPNPLPDRRGSAGLGGSSGGRGGCG